jgi:hypothetical protein
VQATFAPALAGAPSAAAAEVILEDVKLLVAFDSDSGALTRLEDKNSHWVIERRPELAFGSASRHRFLTGATTSSLVRSIAPVRRISDLRVRLVWKDLASE